MLCLESVNEMEYITFFYLVCVVSIGTITLYAFSAINSMCSNQSGRRIRQIKVFQVQTVFLKLELFQKKFRPHLNFPAKMTCHLHKNLSSRLFQTQKIQKSYFLTFLKSIDYNFQQFQVG